MRAGGTCTRPNVRGLPSGAAAAGASSLHLDANDSGTERARPVRHEASVALIDATHK